MKYDFPIINTIEDVLPAVDPQFFLVADRGDHTIISYQFSCKETFPDVVDKNTALRREFRGIIFDKQGKIIRRPLHKFFNVNERVDTMFDQLDVSEEHDMFDKLDGSMIAPYIVDGRMIWGTKMGNTDVTPQVESFIHLCETNLKINGRNENDKFQPVSRYTALANDMIEHGYTPVFEWCSRKQRIVLDYGSDKLILTAGRNMVNGTYMPYWALEKIAKGYDVPIVNHLQYGEGKLSQDFLDTVKTMEDVEGFVIRFKSGHAVKIKCDWYCQLHRIKSDIAFERGVVALLLEEKMDDLKSMMAKEDLDRINDYESKFWKAFSEAADHIVKALADKNRAQISRKFFALEIAPHLEGWDKQIIFRLWDIDPLKNSIGHIVADLLKDTILKQCGRNNKFQEFRKCSIFKDIPVWQEMFMGDAELGDMLE